MDSKFIAEFTNIVSAIGDAIATIRIKDAYSIRLWTVIAQIRSCISFNYDHMNHTQTIKKWIWWHYQENEELGYQCVAWAKKYCEERGYPIRWFSGSAINGWFTGSPFDSSWKRVKYNWFNAPKEWDVIFWSENRCEDGHVAIANKFCYPFLFRYTDQNGGWYEELIQPRWNNGKNILGWFTRV